MTKYEKLAAGTIEHYLTSNGYNYNIIDAGTLGKQFKLEKAPCCGHKLSFSISEETGQWKCYFADCNQTGNYVTLRRMLNDPLPNDRQVINFRQDWRDFFGLQTRGPVTRNKYPEVLKYLHDRGFSNETLDAFRVTNKFDNQVRFPIYAWHQDQWEIVNARIIQVIGEKRNYFDVKGGPTHLLIGNHLMYDHPEKTAYILEGQWDVLTAYELGLRNVFSLPNGAGSVKPEMLQYIPEDWAICLIVDMDPSGDACANKFYNLDETMKSRLTRVHMPHKDLNEWFLAEKELTKEKVLSKRSYRMIPREKNYRTIKRHIPEEAKVKAIVGTPFKGLNELMAGGFYPSEMTSILAASGAGKTTLVNQLAVFAANEGVKIGAIMLEGSENQIDEKLDKTIQGICGDDDKNVIDNLLISSLRGKQVSHAQIIEEVNVMVREDDCKIIIVDNLDFITSGIDQRKYETTSVFMNIARETGCHIIQIWQCNKNDPTKRVNSGSQKGESRIYQDSDNYMNMNYRGPEGKDIEMEKNRQKGRGKFYVNIDYDEKTNCYIEAQNVPQKQVLRVVDLQL